jgi:hypothetical protein
MDALHKEIQLGSFLSKIIMQHTLRIQFSARRKRTRFNGAMLSFGARKIRSALCWCSVRAVLTAGVAGLAIADEVPHAQRTISCTNPASGATWQISIDYVRGTVDSNPARISAAKISWHDPRDGGNYTLDRKSGRLTVIIASSTGGYFLYDQCTFENSG